MIAAAVVRQPYSPTGRFHPCAVGLSHCGSRSSSYPYSRKQNGVPFFEQSVYSQKQRLFPSFGFLPRQILLQTIVEFHQMQIIPFTSSFFLYVVYVASKKTVVLQKNTSKVII